MSRRTHKKIPTTTCFIKQANDLVNLLLFTNGIYFNIIVQVKQKYFIKEFNYGTKLW